MLVLREGLMRYSHDDDLDQALNSAKAAARADDCETAISQLMAAEFFHGRSRRSMETDSRRVDAGDALRQYWRERDDAKREILQRCFKPSRSR